MTIIKIDLAAGEVTEATPEEEARLREVAAVHDAVADFAPVLDGGDPTVDLTEDRTPEEAPTGSYFGTDEFVRIAEQPDAPPSEDQALQDALRAQAHEDGFGDDPADVSDDALWSEFARSWGIEEEGQR